MSEDERDLATRRGASLRRAAEGRGAIVSAFATAGATLGLALGLVEAALFRHIPRVAGLGQPDVRSAIWLIAPLADVPLCALAGLLLGGVATLRSTARPRWRAAWATVGIALAAAYLGWLLDWFRVGPGILVTRQFSLVTPALYFAFGYVAATLLVRWQWRRLRPFFAGARLWNYRLLAGLNLAAFTVFALALAAVRLRGPQMPSRLPAAAAVVSNQGPRHNIVLIMLDTVRADHLSCYGYSRPTSPNLDQLAHQGVLFEDAIAPTSWTLPSLASVLTGLLPHQHGADWTEAMSAQPMTLAEILKQQGYETAAFNANASFGLAGWGLDRGFDVYADAHRWLRHNLAVTFAGQSVYQAIFREFVSFNEFDHLNAGEINQQVIDWLSHRSGRPFFLFINYMDAHRPYVPNAPYDRRFGRIPKPVLWHISRALEDGHWTRPVSPRERQSLIDGYDNSLSYLDEQVGRLLRALQASPDGAETFVIVAGDHGEGFGEHGAYDHGWDLHREVLDVPLIVAGPGIPAERRVVTPAELRELFPTAIELALGNVNPLVRQASLSRFWTPGGAQDANATPVVSELALLKPQKLPAAVLSLCDARWHYLLDSSGRAELYDRQADPAEQVNLATSPELHTVVDQLHARMESALAHSLIPWPNVGYLAPLDRPGDLFFRRAITHPNDFPLAGLPIGSAQAVYSGPSSQSPRPTPAQQELLRSLPYH
ncbi:MAG TPA: sulfatase [Terriglobia bacterium]|nr:sulfatase [Terriglobia bacterium]